MSDGVQCSTHGCDRTATVHGVGLERGYSIIPVSLCDQCYQSEQEAGNVSGD